MPRRLRLLAARVLSLVVLIALAAPLAVAAVIVPRLDWSTTGTDDREETPPLILRSRQATLGDSVGVQVDVEFGDPSAVLATKSGRISSVPDNLNRPGRPLLTTGDVLLSLDGVSQIAMVSPVPPYRNIDVGDSGADVLAVTEYLVAAGLTEDASDSFRWSDGRAISALKRLIGFSDTGRQVPEDMFLWLGPTAFELGSVGPAVGDEVDVGDPLLLGVAPVTSISLQLDRLPSNGESGAYELFIDGAQRSGLLLETALDSLEVELEAEDLARLAPFLQTSYQGAGSVTELSVNATASLARSFEGQLVASAALVLVDGDRYCLLLDDGADGFVAREVTLLATTLDGSLVDGLDDGERYLANPSDVGNSTCV